uniref:Endonuclease/exonuclease/phosphatase domain-containing protein n=1 Tax=Latimeria chalumnae TaxID=7897 RepID=H3AF50_LATCH
SSKSSKSNGPPQGQRKLHVGPTIRICQLNIEGISRSKCEYLERLLKKHSVDVLVLEETHIKHTHLFNTRGRITGFDLIACNNHLKYGLACYVKQGIEDCTELKHTTIAGVFTTAIRVGELTITNVYKPPLVQRPDPPLPLSQHPSIHLGDFNSHHTMWGYEDDNYNGVAIVQWDSLEDKFPLFDAKDRGTFHSSRWKREYNPDLCFLSKDSKGNPIIASRTVLDDFPNSQHRPSIINVGIKVPVITSTPEPRWNFKKAEWETFQKSVDTNIRWIPPTTDAFNRFIGIIKAAAKRSIPQGFRKTYIPCWTEESEALYQKYSLNKSPATATAMLESLNSARRERWKSLVEETNFTHSSRKAWALFRQLGGENPAYKHRMTIRVDAIASHLIQTSKALALGPTAKKWLTSFFSKVLATGKI